MAQIFLFLIGLLSVLAPQVLADTLSEDEATITRCIQTLHSSNETERAQAAKTLRRIVKKYPSKTVNIRWRDGGAALWREKIGRIKVGMDIKEAQRILLNPEFDFLGVYNGPVVSYATAQLDGHWAISIPISMVFSPHSHTDIVRERPELMAFDERIEVKPPARYSGLWAVYYANGQKLRQARYLNGEYDGLSTEYFGNGRRSSQIYMKNGDFAGAYETWYPNGQAEEQHESYRNGKFDGRSRYWYSNGRLKIDSRDINGAPEGLSREWYENGRLESIGSYKQGKAEGTFRDWYENGQQRSEQFWKVGRQEGFRYEWDERGHLLSRRLYRNGEPVDNAVAQ